MFALKRQPKVTIDSKKRIEHLKNEKSIILMLRKEGKKESINFIINLEATFVDQENVNFLFEYLPGQDLFWLK